MLDTLAFSSLARVQSTLQNFYQVRVRRIHRFQPKIEYKTRMGPYELKTASNPQELKETLKFRSCFSQKKISRRTALNLDVDDYDFLCDHLMVIERKSQKLIAALRVSSSLFTDQFSCARSFNISRIMKHPHNKLEFGRLVVDQGYDRDLVTSLIVRGLSDYLIKTDSRLLLGLKNMKVESARQASLFYRHFFQEGRFHPDFSADPLPQKTSTALSLWMELSVGPLTNYEKTEMETLMSPFLKRYFKMGALVSGPPAWNDEANGIEFLTVLRREDLNKNLWKTLRMGSGASVA